MLPMLGSALAVPFGWGSSDADVGAFYKGWKHYGGPGASVMTVPSPKMISPFVR